MRFELTVALKYLIPRWRQLSVSIISLISVLVISLVVWLVVLFLSVTEGIEKKWVEQLVTLNAPIRMAPTEAYYNSYYYKIDSLSYASNYTTKTLGEKFTSIVTDPYDPSFDAELPKEFPVADRHADGSLKDPVREAFEIVQSVRDTPIRAQEYEMTFGNLQLSVVKGEHQNFLNQVTYVASHDPSNTRFAHLLLSPEASDYSHLLLNLPQDQEAFETFFSNVNPTKLRTTEEGYLLHPSLFPKKGHLEGIGIVRRGEIIRVVLPESTSQLDGLEKRLQILGFQTEPVAVDFGEELPGYPLVLDEGILFDAELIDPGVDQLSSLQFKIEGSIQGVPISGISFFEHLQLERVEQLNKNTETDIEPFWAYEKEDGTLAIPSDKSIGEGVLIAKHFQSNGVKLGDRGHLAYYTPTASSMQEQRLPIYVAGFYDPGMLPIGNKLLFVNPDIVALLRSDLTVSDDMLGNGFNLWLDDIQQADRIKETISRGLEEKGLGKYWKVEAFSDYEFARPILQQLKSDKNLFTLIAIIILIVACSNIISMLIILVNDKKKEIGILQALGASPRRIASIFGICGFVCGLISSVIGTFAAIMTLRHLQSLVNLLSFLQGHEAFQAAFYGSQLPNEVSISALGFVVIATLTISLLAGIVPAMKAAKVRPTEILRAE